MQIIPVRAASSVAPRLRDVRMHRQRAACPMFRTYRQYIQAGRDLPYAQGAAASNPRMALQMGLNNAMVRSCGCDWPRWDHATSAWARCSARTRIAATSRLGQRCDGGWNQARCPRQSRPGRRSGNPAVLPRRIKHHDPPGISPMRATIRSRCRAPRRQDGRERVLPQRDRCPRTDRAHVLPA